jgi:hypothetical protein
MLQSGGKLVFSRKTAHDYVIPNFEGGLKWETLN